MAITGVPLTAARDAQPKDGDRIQYKLKASTQIWKGAFVGLDANGLLVAWSDAANISFAGVAYESVLSDASNPFYCRVEKKGSFLANPATGNTFAQSNVGAEVYVNSDNQVTPTVGDVTNAVKCGRIVEFISTTSVRVKINNYC